MEFLTQKQIDPARLITHKLPLKDYTDAFNILANKSESHAVKVLFDFTK